MSGSREKLSSRKRNQLLNYLGLTSNHVIRSLGHVGLIRVVTVLIDTVSLSTKQLKKSWITVQLIYLDLEH